MFVGQAMVLWLISDGDRIDETSSSGSFYHSNLGDTSHR